MVLYIYIYIYQHIKTIKIILCDIQFLIYMQNHHLTHLMLLSHTSVLDHGGANLHLLISLLFLFDERLCEILYI